MSDLNSKDIAVQNASKPEELFLHGGVENVQNPGRIYSFSTFNNVFAALKKGYVEACAGHEVAYGELIAASPGEYRILDEPLLKVELGVAFYKGRNPQLAQKLTKTLHEMRADGTLTTIVEQYGLDSSAVIGE